MSNYTEADDYNSFIWKLRQTDFAEMYGGVEWVGNEKRLTFGTLSRFFLLSTVFYWLCFVPVLALYKRKFDAKKAGMLTNYTISQVHAIIAILFFIGIVFSSCEKPRTNFFNNNECFDITTPGMQLALVFSLAYLVSDLLTSYMVFGPKNFMETAIHHGAGFISIPCALIIGKHLGAMNECFLFTEFSTIFLNFMWILKLTGYEENHTKLKMVNSLMLVLSFVGSRMIFLGYVFFFHYIPALMRYNWE
jgi:hypothetical protein